MFTLYLRRNLSETAVPYNLVLRGAVDDGTRTEVTTGKIFWRYEDEPDMAPQFWRDAVVGYEAAGPFDSKGRDIRLYFIGKTELDTPNAQNFAEAEQVVVEMSQTEVEQLFYHITSKTTTGTSVETLYTDLVEDGQLATNGDVIEFEWSGFVDNSGNTKHLIPKFAGTTLLDVTTTAEQAWKARGTIQRETNTKVLYDVVITINGAAVGVESGEITSLDLDATAYALAFVAHDAVTADTTVKRGHAIYVPAASTNQPWYLDDNGEPYTADDGSIYTR